MVDHERLLIALLSDVDESLHGKYDFEKIVANHKTDENGNYVCETSDFVFIYDKRTYDQIEGWGGG